MKTIEQIYSNGQTWNIGTKDKFLDWKQHIDSRMHSAHSQKYS